ncbi:hypothetical protein M0R45_018978 [Rubus argutus]|uniref:Uncharacterized protein n=1 Tax=Rubus argutus TaxID=59490 RepID=A0AAW1X449_RUBAR
MSNKPDKPLQDSSVEENEKQEKANWDNTAIDIFIMVYVGETLVKNRAGVWAPSQDFGVEVENAPGLEEENDNIMMEDDLEYAKAYNPHIDNIGEREQHGTPSPIEAPTQDKGNRKKTDGKKHGVGIIVSKQLDDILNAITNRSSASKIQDKHGCSIDEQSNRQVMWLKNKKI